MKNKMFMKKILLVIMLALTVQLTRADYTFGPFNGSGANISIPTLMQVGGPLSVATVSGVSGRVTGMSLELNISGGFNGDLYAYLVAPDQATTATLLGNPGGNFDQMGNGYNITLVSSGATGGNIQDASQPWGTAVTGTYYAEVPLLTAFGSYLTAHGANGDWRLFIANQSSGDINQSVLGSWSLSMITTSAVPEPDQVAAISLLGLIGLMVGSYRHWSRVLGIKRGENQI